MHSLAEAWLENRCRNKRISIDNKKGAQHFESRLTALGFMTAFEWDPGTSSRWTAPLRTLFFSLLSTRQYNNGNED